MPRSSPTPTSFDPLVVPLTQAPLYFGLSRSALYRAAAHGHISLKKLGRSTLVDVASVRAWLAKLPVLVPCDPAARAGRNASRKTSSGERS